MCTKKQCPRGCKCVDENVSSIIGTSRKGKWVTSIRNGIDVRSVPLPLSARVLSQDIIQKIEQNYERNRTYSHLTDFDDGQETIEFTLVLEKKTKFVSIDK